MKATFYAVFAGNRWRWHLSLDMRVDVHHWFGHNRCGAMIRFDPQVPLGLAVMWKQALSAANRRYERAEQMREDMIRLAEQWQLAETIAGRLSCKLWKADNPPPREAPPVDGRLLAQLEERLQGRSLLQDELLGLMADTGLQPAADGWKAYIQTAYLRGTVQLSNGLSLTTARAFPFFKRRLEYRCRRCGGGSDKLHRTECAACGSSRCVYCEQCLTMGRARFCSVLICGTAGHTSARFYPGQTPIDAKWGLSPPQAEASAAAIRFLAEPAGGDADGNRPPCFLIWAVTGAGKTEMIYPLIDYALSGGGNVLIATPRRDVVLELEPRLKRAFPGRSLVTLYGGSGQRWEQGDITLATTHQLLRFWQKFDLVVIDELDAFPYHNNPMLEFAAQKVCRPTGKYVLLSATPPVHLQKAAKRNALPHVKVPVRFHRHPLPVPKLLRTPSLHKALNSRSIPSSLRKRLQASLDRGAQIFVFVPKIQYVDPLVAVLRGNFPQASVQGTSSRDPDRAGKVREFRAGSVRILVTTTILERGVTIPKSDVFILDADSPLFDSAALVQMAGRAGRSLDDPAGRVVFAASEKTRSQADAVRQIVSMNRIAKKKGYLRAASPPVTQSEEEAQGVDGR